MPNPTPHQGAEPDFEGATRIAKHIDKMGHGYVVPTEWAVKVARAYLARSAEAAEWQAKFTIADAKQAVWQLQCEEAEALAGKLREALAGMVGLIDLLLVRDDLSENLRFAITSSHRLIDGRRALK